MKICILLLLAAQSAYAQFTDDFNDGDLLNGPVWHQPPGAFIINPEGRLQSAWQIPDQTFSITTPSTQVTGAWHFSVRLNLATSGTNYTDVFLNASSYDLSANGTTGYFIRVGGTPDEISLFRKDAGSITCIIDGTNATVQANQWYHIKVIRDHQYRFTIYYEVEDRFGEIYTGVVDSVYTASSYFGISVTQSTASFFGKHFFDDVYVGPHTPDTTPPLLTRVYATDSVTAVFVFDEAVRWDGYLPSFFYMEEGVGFPYQVDCVGLTCTLRYQTVFPQRIAIPVRVEDARDVWGNVSASLTDTLFYVQPGWGDMLIHEIFADPEPPQQLPVAEWVEIKNVSSFPMQLSGWKICKEPGVCSGPFPERILLPDSVMILTSTSAPASLFGYGTTLVIPSFPSLNNAGDVLYLKSPDNRLIHTVAYTDAWHENALKKIGGWSLEMQDTQQPCMGEGNWTSSRDDNGGTPGRYNSVMGLSANQTAFRVERSYATDSMHVRLFFSEPLAIEPLQPLQIEIQPSVGGIDTLFIEEPQLSTIFLRLQQPLQRGMVYTLTVRNVRSCAGEVLTLANVPLAIAEPPAPGDVIIHEVLFNPTPSGIDFVEIYNRSQHAIDLKYLFIAHESASGMPAQITQVHPSGYTLFPGSLLVLSEHQQIIQSAYYCKYPDRFVDMVSLPSYNDDKGTVILLNHAGEEVDRVAYQSDWHFPLLNEVEGVSLERIHREGASNRKEVWHSASRDVGYATPGYENSQQFNAPATHAQYSFSGETVSPDNDGRDDFLHIEYTFREAGYMSNVIIFDIHGRAVRFLHRNILNGTSGSWRWDGLGERMQVLPTGRYIVYIEAFDTRGAVEKYKKVINLINQ